MPSSGLGNNYVTVFSQQMFEVGILMYLKKKIEHTVEASQFWRPEIQNQCVGKAMLPLKALSLPLPDSGGSLHSLACSSITQICASVFTLLCSCLWSFYFCFLFLELLPYISVVSFFTSFTCPKPHCLR